MKKFSSTVFVIFALFKVAWAQQSVPNTPEYHYEKAKSTTDDLETRLYHAELAIKLNQSGLPENHEKQYSKENYIRQHHFTRARLVVQLRDWEKAYKYYQYMRLKDKNDANLNYELGTVCLKLAQPNDDKELSAVDYLEQAANSTRTDSSVKYWVGYGEVLLLRGKRNVDTKKLEQAADWFKKAIDVKNKHYLYAPHQGLGEIYTILQQLEPAKFHFDMASKHASAENRSKIELYRGDLAFQRGDYRVAAEHYKKATENDAHEAWIKYGRTLFKLKSWDEAHSTMSRAIEQNPTHEYYFDRCDLLYTRRSYQEALSDINEALKQARKSKYLYKRGCIQHQLSNYERAMEDFQGTIRILDSISEGDSGVKLATVHAFLGWSRYQQGVKKQDKKFWMDAEKDFERSLKLNPREALGRVGTSLVAKSLLKSVLWAQQLDTIVDENANYARARLERGIWAYGQKHYKRAISDLTHAIRLMNDYTDPDMNEQDLNLAYEHRMLANQALEQWQEVEKDLKPLTRYDSVKYLLSSAMFNFHNNKLTIAQAELKQYLSSDDKHPMAWLYESYLLEHDADLQGSFMAITKAKQFNKNYPKIQAQYEKLFEAFKKTRKAVIQWCSPSDFNWQNQQVFYNHELSKEIIFKARVTSLSATPKISFHINEQKQNINLLQLNDTLYELELKYPIHKAQNLDITISVSNQAGVTAQSKTIWNSDKSNCQKPKLGLALVIGNQHYKQNPLQNTIQDAQSVADSLKRLGWYVILVLDATTYTLDTAFHRFARLSKDYKMGLVYYAGHGMESATGGENYLLGTDYNSKMKLETTAYRLQNFFNILREDYNQSEHRACQYAIIVDACRSLGSNSFKSQEQLPNDTWVGFSADTGQTAADTTPEGSPNGLFTHYFLRYLTEKVSLQAIFQATGEEVTNASQKEQRPTYGGNIYRSIFLQ
jgi:Caspase domain/Tetratricopeptide repeat